MARQESELKQVKQMLDSPKVEDVRLKKQRPTKNPVFKVSNALNQYKAQRNKAEDVLVKTIQKVNLDKMILLKEKQRVIWNAVEQESNLVQANIKKQRAQRFLLNQKQRKAYMQVLQFLKTRGTAPMQEEKQIMDGIYILLQNGWTIKTDELVKQFGLLGLEIKSSPVEENLKFLEFVYLLAKLFEIDQRKIKEIFI